ncbi:metallophosphoesterase [archaeon]|nr:metallophosphoesterase [archaeon]
MFTDNHSSGSEKLITEGMNSVDLIISTGDSIEIPVPTELWKALIPFCETNKPFYAIPGNYESQESWNAACAYLLKKYPNFINAANEQVYRFDKYDLIFIPGVENFEAGFEVNEHNLKRLLKKVDKLNNKILFCHEPPKQDYSTGTDAAVQARSVIDGSVIFGRNTKDAIDSGLYKKEFVNRGSELIRSFIDRAGINFVFSGHLHESIGAVDYIGRKIEEEEFTKSLYLNPGPAKNGIYAIVTIEESNGILKAKYERKMLFGKTGYEDLK